MCIKIKIENKPCHVHSPNKEKHMTCHVCIFVTKRKSIDQQLPPQFSQCLQITDARHSFEIFVSFRFDDKSTLCSLSK